MEENIDCKPDEPKSRPLVSPALILGGLAIVMAGISLAHYYYNSNHKIKILSGAFEKKYRKTPRMKKPRKQRRIYRKFYKTNKGKLLQKFLNTEIMK